MDIILVPGLWLDASSWEGIVPVLEDAGHRPHPLTMPGVGEPASLSADIGIADWVAATVAEIDRLPGEVVLVGHSGGGNVVYGAAADRSDRVSRIVFLDTFPPPDGHTIWEFPVVDGVVPFPGWDSFDAPEVDDLDESTRATWAARARSVPARVPTDPIVLRGDGRHDIPLTMLSGTMSEADVRDIVAQAPEWAAELTNARDLEIVELRSGHWPQFSKPAEVADAILRAIDR